MNLDKEAILDFVRNKLKSGEITPADLLSLAGAPASPAPLPLAAPAAAAPRHMNVSKVLYYLGGLIVLTGVSVFVSQFWSGFGSGERIAIALGGAVLAYAIGIGFSFYDKESELGAAFHLIGGVMFPFGAFTLLTELSVQITSLTWVYVFFVLTVLYAGTMVFVAYPLVTFFTVANGTIFLFALVQYLLQGAYFSHWYDYFAIVMGASYLYLGYAFVNTRNQALSNILFFVGSLWVLGGAFALYDILPLWAVLYPLLIAGMVALSLYVKRMPVLVISTISIMAYVAYITGKYFANSLGWPLALIIIGLLFVATGYLTFYLNRTYIAVSK